MNTKNKIFLIGNGFDLAHNFKTKFSDFAQYYLEEIIVPELIVTIRVKAKEHKIFKTEFTQHMAWKNSNSYIKDPENIIWYLAQENNHLELKKYLSNNYHVLDTILSNSLLARLYHGKEKNWFDIENIYFQELIPFKDQALRKPKLFNAIKLKTLNSEFAEIKSAVVEYLKTIEISSNEKVKNFLKIHTRDCANAYFINFNYTSTLAEYIEISENFKVNHIHGTLKNEDVIFGYGNDQNNHYQEMKELEIEEFLEFFKTFEYLQNINYDKIYEEALDRFSEYEVYILGHSLGMTDKTLVSEILNTEKCKKIYLFKRTDLKENSLMVLNEYRKLTYAASRTLTDEKVLRKKIVNFKRSSFFPY